MRKIIIVSAFTLAACTSTGDLTPQAQKVVNVLCTADQAAPVAVQAGAVVVSVAVPASAPEAALATQLDPAVHAAVQAECSKAAPGTVPAAVINPAAAPAPSK